jgi:crotonobetainyl-CoA:carnitine CoA-transferase CaiB-like acyl-CoA transferase
LLAADVPSAPIYTLDEALADPQVEHLGMVKELSHPKVGKVRLLGGAVTFSDTPSEILSPAPTHGQHTGEILARYGIRPGKAAE